MRRLAWESACLRALAADKLGGCVWGGGCPTPGPARTQGLCKSMQEPPRDNTCVKQLEKGWCVGFAVGSQRHLLDQDSGCGCRPLSLPAYHLAGSCRCWWLKARNLLPCHHPCLCCSGFGGRALPGKTSLMSVVRRSTIRSTAASPRLSSGTCGVSSLQDTTVPVVGAAWEGT